MTAALFPLLLPCAARADDIPLTAEAFEAIVEGKTFDTYGLDGLYGVETFLPDRKTLWRDADRCLHGTWYEQDGMICYRYEEEPDVTFCSSFFDRRGWILGWRDGIFGDDPVMLQPSDEPVTCDAPLSS